MKLFYWDSVEALADNSPGYAFAMAASREEAVEAVLDFYGGSCEVQATLRAELVSNPPEIFDGPCGFTIAGSA